MESSAIRTTSRVATIAGAIKLDRYSGLKLYVGKQALFTVILNIKIFNGLQILTI
jgi:hypothetical protein